MKKLLLLTAFVLTVMFAGAQAYVKLIPYSETTLGSCDAAIDVVAYGATGPYMVTWWDNSWQPSTGLRAENLCGGKTITVDLVDMDCRKLHTNIYIDSDPSKQVTLDTVIITMPSAPGMNNGSLSFHLNNVAPTHTRLFATPGSGGVTTDSVFTGLGPGLYNYSIYGPVGVIYEVGVSLDFASDLLPCLPLTDSITLTGSSNATSCNGEILMNTSGATPGSYYRYIYMYSGGGATQVNTDEYINVQTDLCPGPYLVDTYSDMNNYWVRTTVYIDDLGLADSTWGAPPIDSLDGMIVDTVLLSALTNCGLDYTVDVDTAFVSNYVSTFDDNYEVEISLIQGTDTTNVYSMATFDTSHVICFDITLFCSDSVLRTTSPVLRNIVFLDPYISPGVITSTGDYAAGVSAARVYPNPSNGNVSIVSPQQIKLVEIYGMEGKLMRSITVSGKQANLDLSGIAPSTLLLKVYHNNLESEVVRLVKLH